MASRSQPPIGASTRLHSQSSHGTMGSGQKKRGRHADHTSTGRGRIGGARAGPVARPRRACVGAGCGQALRRQGGEGSRGALVAIRGACQARGGLRGADRREDHLCRRPLPRHAGEADGRDGRRLDRFRPRDDHGRLDPADGGALPPAARKTDREGGDRPRALPEGLPSAGAVQGRDLWPADPLPHPASLLPQGPVRQERPDPAEDLGGAGRGRARRSRPRRTSPASRFPTARATARTSWSGTISCGAPAANCSTRR